MKTSRKIYIVIVLILLVIASFFAGSSLAEQKNSNDRVERCITLILFAIDKVENGDFSDEDTIKALISNVYAAYQFCDDTKAANQLHGLWNYIIFEGDGNLDDVKEIALTELNAALHAIKTGD